MKRDHDEVPQALPATAEPAWRAYTAMLESKSAHYGFLETLETKYRHGGKPSLAEQARLGTLLNTHDRCVRAFAEAIKSLGVADADARAQLIQLLTEIAPAAGTAAH